MFAKLGYYICVPFAFLTRLFYSWTGSYGVALILFTLVVKLVLLPFQLKSKKSMLRMNRMQGKLNDIGAALFNAYIFQSFNNLEDEIMVQQEEQQQQLRRRDASPA